MKKNNENASNKQTKTSVKNPKCMAIPTLLDAMDKVAIESDDSELNDKFFQKVAPEIGLLSDCFGITEHQAVLLSVSLQRGPYHVDFGDFAFFAIAFNIKKWAAKQQKTPKTAEISHIFASCDT